MPQSQDTFPNGGGRGDAAPAPPGQILTGKQEHCKGLRGPWAVSRLFYSVACANARLCVCADLKRELIARQVRDEISELNSPTALQRFGAPFRSEFGEVAPVDSELPILRYIFVHHVRNFPFLDQAREKEFWQDKLQVVGSWPCRTAGSR